MAARCWAKASVTSRRLCAFFFSASETSSAFFFCSVPKPKNSFTLLMPVPIASHTLYNAVTNAASAGKFLTIQAPNSLNSPVNIPRRDPPCASPDEIVVEMAPKFLKKLILVLTAVVINPHPSANATAAALTSLIALPTSVKVASARPNVTNTRITPATVSLKLNNLAASSLIGVNALSNSVCNICILLLKRCCVSPADS